MATITERFVANTTLNQATYTVTAFTPGAGELLAAFVAAPATVAAGIMTSSVAGQSFTRITTRVKNSSADTLYFFIGDQLVGAASQQVTFDCTGDNAGGVFIYGVGVSGMSIVGAAAVRQSAGQSNASAGTPAPAFATACLTANPTMGCVFNATNPAGLTTPTGWSEEADLGIATPTSGAQYVIRNSGFTGTTVTWGSASASAFASLIVELDSSVPIVERMSPALGAVRRAATW